MQISGNIRKTFLTGWSPAGAWKKISAGFPKSKQLYNIVLHAMYPYLWGIIMISTQPEKNPLFGLVLTIACVIAAGAVIVGAMHLSAADLTKKQSSQGAAGIQAGTSASLIPATAPSNSAGSSDDDTYSCPNHKVECYDVKGNHIATVNGPCYYQWGTCQCDWEEDKDWARCIAATGGTVHAIYSYPCYG